MRKKSILRLFLLIAVSILLYSCMNEDLYSSAEKEKQEIQSKSLWKEDMVFITNVKEIFLKNANLENFKNNHGGLPQWDYAMTFGNFDESYLMVPVFGENTVTGVVTVKRIEDKVYFKFSEDEKAKSFFTHLVFSESKKLSPVKEIAENAKIVCSTRSITVCTPNNDGSQDCTTTSTTRCISEENFEDNDMGGDNSGDNGLPYGGGGSGNNTNPQQNQNPCEKLKAQTSNTTFKNNITALQGKTGNSYESGYRIGSNADGSLQNQLLQNIPGSQQVDMKIFSNTTTLLHSHYDGLYPMFSPGDIILFNRWIVWAQGWNAVTTNTPKIPLNNLTLTVVTSYGNYSFNFDGTSATAFPNHTQQQLEDLNKLYAEQYLNNAVTVGNVSGNASYDMQKLEKEFLNFMNEEMNMQGLKLYRTTDSGNTELGLNTNGTLKETNCP